MPLIVWINYANSIMMEGLRLREMGLVSNGAYNINQNYIRVCFNVHSSGGKDGELNEHWEAWEECLKHSVGLDIIHLVFVMVEVVVLRSS